MSKQITIKNNLYERFLAMKGNDKSYSDVIYNLFLEIAALKTEMELKSNNLQEVEINQEGRFQGSKTLAGNTILYKVKE